MSDDGWFAIVVLGCVAGLLGFFALVFIAENSTKRACIDAGYVVLRGDCLKPGMVGGEAGQ